MDLARKESQKGTLIADIFISDCKKDSMKYVHPLSPGHGHDFRLMSDKQLTSKFLTTLVGSLQDKGTVNLSILETRRKTLPGLGLSGQT
jgi:hypothetical protein